MFLKSTFLRRFLQTLAIYIFSTYIHKMHEIEFNINILHYKIV